MTDATRTSSPTPIPEPRRILSRTLQCPDCARTFKTRELARYALHWRLVHGSDPVRRTVTEAPL
jgi:hypothetical protein